MKERGGKFYRFLKGNILLDISFFLLIRFRRTTSKLFFCQIFADDVGVDTNVKFSPVWFSAGATIGAVIGAVSWVGGAVKIFRTRNFWKRAILKYLKNFSILFIENERESNKKTFSCIGNRYKKFVF